MKKYKLIKEYPEGPKLNSIVRIESPISNAELYCPNDLILLHACFGTYWVENKKYSEFWEEIKSCNLIVDKWNKVRFDSNKIYYFKPFNNKKNCGESLFLVGDSKTYTYYSKDSWDCNDIKSAELLNDLTEIQNYLPAYHRDKIKKLPEYVKCIRNNEFDYGTNGVGKIFKVIGETDSKNDYLLSYNNEKLVSSDKRRFIPASKEEYDAQFVKDYEILSFKGMFPTNNGLFTLKDGKYYYETWIGDSENGLSLKNMRIDHIVKIHSIKRLSDGEVFTVGDVLEVRSKKDAPLKWINLLSDRITIGTGYSMVVGLHEIRHAKQPLFKTEDGFNVYEGNTYYNLWEKSFGNKLKPFEINGPHKAIEIEDDFIKYNKECKYFSTKEAAEKWVLMNKPSLSINDILK